MSTKTRFEKEAKGNSEMTYLHVLALSEPEFYGCCRDIEN